MSIVNDRVSQNYYKKESMWHMQSLKDIQSEKKGPFNYRSARDAKNPLAGWESYIELIPMDLSPGET